MVQASDANIGQLPAPPQFIQAGVPNTNPYGPMTNNITSIIQALMQKGMQKPGGLDHYEGDVASPANPFNSGVYGMPGQDPQAAAQPAAPDPFSQGAAPVPYTDPTMSALFSQPPTG